MDLEPTNEEIEQIRAERARQLAEQYPLPRLLPTPDQSEFVGTDSVLNEMETGIEKVLTSVHESTSSEAKEIIDAFGEVFAKTMKRADRKTPTQATVGKTPKIPDSIRAEFKRLIDHARAGVEDPGACDQAARLSCIGFLRKILRNEFEGKGARWASNITNVTIRTGITVFLCQMLKEYITFEIEKQKAKDGNVSIANILGITSLVFAAALQFADLARKYCTNTSTLYNMLSRIGLVLVGFSAVGACLATQSEGALILRMPAIMAFVLARDLSNALFPLTSNVTRMPKRAVLMGGAVYAVAQYFVGVGSDLGAPKAGAGGVPALSSSSNDTDALALIATSSLVLSDTALKAALNAIADVMDDVVAPTLLYSFGRPGHKRSLRMQELALEKYSEYEQKLTEVAKEVLAEKSASKRKEMIRSINIEMYVAEMERLQVLFMAGPMTNEIEQQIFKRLLQLKSDGVFADPKKSKVELAPASVMASRSEHVPDFVTLDERLKADFAKVDKNQPKKLSDSQIKAYVRQLYIDAFVDCYMPMQCSDLQRKAKTEILATRPELMPNLLRAAIGEKVKLALAPPEGLRLSLSSNVPHTAIDFVRRFGNQMFNTAPARMAFYIEVFGFVIASAKAIETATEDPESAPWVLNLVLFIVVFVGYFKFYGVHHEPKGRRLQLPSGYGGDVDETDSEESSEEDIAMLSEQIQKRDREIRGLLEQQGARESSREPRGSGSQHSSSST